MREVKFRYGYTDGKSWFFKSFTLDQIEGGYQYDEISDQPLLRDYRIKSRDEYTGLKDKNGKEIYEGDKVKYKDGSCGYVYYSTTGGMVCYCIDFTDEKAGCYFEIAEVYSEQSAFEVVGNIHEDSKIE
jgi:uncharacterized phage protein (TIGR01671 family)